MIFLHTAQFKKYCHAMIQVEGPRSMSASSSLARPGQPQAECGQCRVLNTRRARPARTQSPPPHSLCCHGRCPSPPAEDTRAVKRIAGTLKSEWCVYYRHVCVCVESTLPVPLPPRHPKGEFPAQRTTQAAPSAVAAAGRGEGGGALVNTLGRLGHTHTHKGGERDPPAQ